MQMIISPKKILELNKKYRLIENLDEREKNPEGVGIDLRVGEVYILKGKGFMGVNERSTPTAEKVAEFKGKNTLFVLKAHEYVLVKTIERLNIPGKKIIIEKGMKPVYLMPHVYPRGTFLRSGVELIASKTDPGYFGELTFALANLRDADFEFELGARIANVVFHTVQGELSRPYGGQWKGGRVSAEKRERQI
jgi:deoxycytidine triphosphate deaminase